MKVYHKIESWIKEREGLNFSIGFVPTMGGLHEGHGSLIKESLKYNHFTVVSLYTNPTQFDEQSDFDTYPMNLEEDLVFLKNWGVDAVLIPSFEDIYPDNYTLKVTENTLSSVLEGEKRPGHFDGMLTVVTKLLNIVRPKNTYFGEKDFQQLILVKKLVQALFIPTNIIGVETKRESDGLAMSSRNRKLNEDARYKASLFSHLLKSTESDDVIKDELQKEGFRVEYISSKWNRRLGAVKIDNVRLIDNVEI